MKQTIIALACVALRILGVTLAVGMILGSPFVGWHSIPDAQMFISKLPNVLFLFGWFLVPYSLLRSKVVWGVFFIPLCVVSVLLVRSAVTIYEYYDMLYAAPVWAAGQREEVLFLICLSLFTCAIQPVAVALGRCFRIRIDRCIRSSIRSLLKVIRNAINESKAQNKPRHSNGA